MYTSYGSWFVLPSATPSPISPNRRDSFLSAANLSSVFVTKAMTMEIGMALGEKRLMMSSPHSKSKRLIQGHFLETNRQLRDLLVMTLTEDLPRLLQRLNQER